jgi:hypothetical protein
VFDAAFVLWSLLSDTELADIHLMNRADAEPVQKWWRRGTTPVDPSRSGGEEVWEHHSMRGARRGRCIDKCDEAGVRAIVYLSCCYHGKIATQDDQADAGEGCTIWWRRFLLGICTSRTRHRRTGLADLALAPG